MPDKANISIIWPARGVCKRQGFPLQPPFTAPAASNVRPYDTQKRRAGGGTRPGLVQAWDDTAGDTIQGMAEATVVSGTTTQVRTLVVASGSLWVEQSDGTLYDAGGSMNSTDRLQIATWAQTAYIADNGGGRLAKECDLTDTTPSVVNWVTGTYTLKRFQGADGTYYPLFRSNAVLTYYFDQDDNKYPGWPYTTSFQPYEGSLTLQDGTVVTEAGQLFVKKWGSAGTANGQFDQPFGIAIDSTGRVIVTDSSNHRVQIFSQDGEHLATFGSNGTGNGQFDEPRGVCVDSSDNIYVVDAGNDRIQKFTKQGVYTAQVGATGTGNGQFNNPRWICTDNTYLYVTDAQNDRVQRLTMALAYDSQWGSTGTGNGQFSNPRGIALDSDGNVWVADSGNDRLQEFTAAGVYQSQWGSGTSTKEPGKFNLADGIAIDSNDNVYVVDTNDGRIQKFEADGTFISQFGRAGSADGEFDEPIGVALGAQDELYISDNGNDRIQKMVSPDSLPYVTVDTDDNIRDYTAGSNLNYIVANELVGIYKGTVPTGCPMIARWQDRIVLAGSPAHVVYFSRAGDPDDFDYGADPQDVGRATFLSSTADSGGIGEPITALIAFSDDFLVIGCKTSLWVLRGGSPTAGGRFNNISRTIGIVDKDAWCEGPAGEILFLSSDGLYVISPLSNAQPIPISPACLPQEFLDIDPATTTVSMAYNPRFRGVNIYLTGAADLAFWLDWDTMTFWPESYDATHEPTACARIGNNVFLGCSDGVIRKYSDGATDDDGIAFPTFVLFGPFRGGRSSFNEGLIREMQAAFGDDSANVTWEIYSGDTAQRAVDAAAAGTAPKASGTWAENYNLRHHPRVRGAWFVIRVETSAPGRWVLEQIDLGLNLYNYQRS